MSEQREVLSVTPELDCTNYLEVGGRAVWAVSSAKPGNGAEQLRDGDTGSFWQSDGTHPHTISVQFLHKTDVCRVCLYVDYAVDESYTPKRVAVRSGSCAHDLVDVAALDLADPVGWVGIDVQQIEYDPSSSLKSLVPLRTHLLQIKVTHFASLRFTSLPLLHLVFLTSPADREHAPERTRHAREAGEAAGAAVGRRRRGGARPLHCRHDPVRRVAIGPAIYDCRAAVNKRSVRFAQLAVWLPPPQ